MAFSLDLFKRKNRSEMLLLIGSLMIFLTGASYLIGLRGQSEFALVNKLRYIQAFISFWVFLHFATDKALEQKYRECLLFTPCRTNVFY